MFHIIIQLISVIIVYFEGCDTASNDSFEGLPCDRGILLPKKFINVESANMSWRYHAPGSVIAWRLCSR